MARLLMLISLVLSGSFGALAAKAQTVKDQAEIFRREEGMARPTVPHGPPEVAAVLQLSRRLEALERQVAALISAVEVAQRDLSEALAVLKRQKADVEARLVVLEMQPDPAVSVPAAAPPQQSAGFEQSPEQQFLDAVGLAEQGEWAKAELAFDTFARRFPEHSRMQEARFWIGKSLAANGRTVQAAQVFLDLYEHFPDASFAVDNLMALGAALVAIGPDNATQACQVYDEIAASFQDKIDPARRDTILRARLKANCQ